MSQDNLHSLKDDMVAFTEGHGMRRLPGYVSEEIATVLWEDDENPDSWKDFVETAKAANAPFLTMSEIVLEKEDLELLIEELSDMSFGEEDSDDIEQAQTLVQHVGKVGFLQLGFAHQGIVFLHETSTEWYDHYQQMLESIEDFSDIVLDQGEGEDEEP